jgi:putative DNA primase/helicase
MTGTSQTEEPHMASKLKTLLYVASQLNFPILPLEAGGKKPVLAGGVHSATTDVADLTAYFRANPDASYGIATGGKARIGVLDVDGTVGRASLKSLTDKHGQLPKTVTVKTGNGTHRYFRFDDNQIRNSVGTLGAGIDFRGDGGYVVGPGCTHPSGHTYQYEKGRALGEVEIALAPPWLRKAVQAKLATATLATTDGVTEGKRNLTLTSLAGRLWNAGIAPEALTAALLAENQQICDPPLDKAEVEKIAASIAQYPVKSLDAGGDVAEELMQLVLQQHFASGEHLMFCVDGQFWGFDSCKWIAVSRTWLQGRILETIPKLPDRRGHTTTSLIAAVTTLLSAKVNADDDRLRFLTLPPNVINCVNGELWIGDDGAVDLRPHSAKSYLRHSLDIPYDPAAKCPLYDAAVREIFSKSPDPKAMKRHWSELAGYFIAPRRKLPQIIVLRGNGSNGKSKLVETVTHLVGSDQVAAFRIENLGNNRFAIGGLLGKTVLLDDDVRAGARVPDGELKKISEPKFVTGERKFGPPFNFTIRAVPILICNNVPSVADLSYGMQRRLMVIPFDRTFTKKDMDTDLFERIRATEMSGVLNRALNGLRRLNKRNGQFKVPVSVRKATQRLIAEANPLPGFLAERCKRSVKATCWIKDLYRSYCRWSQEMGYTLTQQQPTVKRNLVQLGYVVKHGNQGNKVHGLQLLSS